MAAWRAPRATRGPLCTCPLRPLRPAPLLAPATSESCAPACILPCASQHTRGTPCDTQRHPLQVLEDFRASTTRFLITTNVLSRGIDVPAVTLVIQFDMPVKKGGHYDPETYLHRVGRTGRFGRPGATGRWRIDWCHLKGAFVLQRPCLAMENESPGAALNMIHDDTELRFSHRPNPTSNPHP